MSKAVTAAATLIVIVIAAIAIVGSGVLDSVTGDGEGDVEYQLINRCPVDVTVTFSDGLNESRTMTIVHGETETFTVHYKWDNKLPMGFTAKCQYKFLEDREVSSSILLTDGGKEIQQIELTMTAVV